MIGVMMRSPHRGKMALIFGAFLLLGVSLLLAS